MTVVIHPAQAGQLRVEADGIIDFEWGLDGELGPRTEVGVIREGHERVESVIAAGKLEDNQDRGILARGYRGVGREGVEREERTFEEGGNRPGNGSPEHRGAQELPTGVQGLVHVIW
jgi:hypothetical protein